MVKQQVCKDGQFRIFAGRLVNPGSSERDVLVTVENNRIVEISPAADGIPKPGDIDASKYIVVPGLIDIHIHGSAGETFLKDCSPNSRGFLASRGTTAFLATTTTASREKFLNGIKRLRKCISQQSPQDGAQMLGIRCESPFLEPSLGAQKGDLCWPVNNENISALLDAAGEDLRIMDVSPELKGVEALVKEVVKRGIIVSAAHTRATSEQMARAFKAGLSHMTHIFNATELPPSKAGQGTLGVGADEFSLINDAITTEVIVDSGGFHVSPYWLQILFRCKDKSKICLISDAGSIAGQAQGEYLRPDGNRTILRAGEDVGWLESGDTKYLCGSAMTLHDAMLNLMAHLKMPLKEVIECATLNPAKVLRLDQYKGSIEQGKDADLVVLDDNLQVVLTMIAGEVVFRNLSL
jgi:N-acetylglucosamine-6-phosphate deacetylase